jgi:glyoxylase-like metal-dependent hydrolase (beta-lactamase superfamily II)
MDSESIIKQSGMITKDIYHLDILQYNLPRSCSIYLLMTPESIIIMDIGTSDDVDYILKFFKKKNISLERIKYLIPSHHHFDHFGGGWKLWHEIQKFNPDVKVITTVKTKKLLQDSKEHLKRAKRTFGELIGMMHPLPDEAYEIVKINENIPISGLKKQFKLIATPGHTNDHICPTLINNGKTEFVYLSECAGGILNSQKLVTVPSSMPPDFNFDIYVQSLRKIIDLKPLNVGYAHSGAVRGCEAVKQILEEHLDFSFYFRDFVENKYNERGETRYVVEQFIEQEMKNRTENFHHELTSKYVVAVIYGQLIDLGLKEPK